MAQCVDRGAAQEVCEIIHSIYLARVFLICGERIRSHVSHHYDSDQSIVYTWPRDGGAVLRGVCEIIKRKHFIDAKVVVLILIDRRRIAIEYHSVPAIM